MAATGERQRVRDEVVRLVHRIADVPQLAHEVTRVLRRAVPFDGTCLLTMDPATLLPTGDVVENALPPSAAVRLTEIELREPDVNKFTDLARGRLPAAGLAEATAGELDRSTRHRELRRPSGFDDELRVVLTGATRHVGRAHAAARGTAPPLHAGGHAAHGLARRAARRRRPPGRPARGRGRRRRRHRAAGAGTRLLPRDRQPGRAPLARRAGSGDGRASSGRAARRGRPGSGDRAGRADRRDRCLGTDPDPDGQVGDRAGLAAGRRAGRPGRRAPGDGAPGRARPAHRRRLRSHGPRAPGHRTGGAGVPHERDRRPGCTSRPTPSRTT